MAHVVMTDFFAVFLFTAVLMSINGYIILMIVNYYLLA